MELYVDIKKQFHDFKLDVKFHINNDITALLGASGSGKSMTLRCIAGIETPDSGKIVLNGNVLFDSNKNINISTRKRKIGYLFQNYALFTNMTVEENIGFALDKCAKDERKKIISEKISMMKLLGLEKRYPTQLSGGQQQRVALARALAIEPEILLLDEPFSALDEHLRSVLTKQLVDALKRYHGVTIFVTHNMDEAYKICREIVVLHNGGVETQGNKEEIFRKPSTMTTASLTGCKNFSRVQYISQNCIKAVDWGIVLKTKDILDKSIQYVGIRAHYIEQTSENNNDNIIECSVSSFNESPFNVTVYLNVNNKPVDNHRIQDNYDIQWEISKEQWLELREYPQPWRLSINPDRLLLFNQ